MNVVISQPMFFPWIGMFEQIRLADVYINYSDVQFSKGSFVNRVQIKSATGIKWLTVPLHGLSLGQKINEVLIDNRKDWRNQHLEILRSVYARASFCHDMLTLVESVYRDDYKGISELSEATIRAVCRYFGFDAQRLFLDSCELGIDGSSSRRVLNLVLEVGGNQYITGLGARNYLEHGLFDAAGIRVQYMDYRKLEYPQQFGEFTPYVSVLDLIANVGRDGKRMICSETIYWKDFLNG